MKINKKNCERHLAAIGGIPGEVLYWPFLLGLLRAAWAHPITALRRTADLDAARVLLS